MHICADETYNGYIKNIDDYLASIKLSVRHKGYETLLRDFTYFGTHISNFMCLLSVL